MAKTKYLIEGRSPEIWLDLALIDRGVSNAALTRELKALGHEKANKVTVGKWRTGQLLLPLPVLPSICDALGYTVQETERITAAAVADANPRVGHLLLDDSCRSAARRTERLELKKENARLKRTLRVMVAQFETVIAEHKLETGAGISGAR